MNAITITVPRVPISMNQQERMHWTKWQKEKRGWIHDVFYLVNQHGYSVPKNLKHIKIKRILIYFDKIRTRDESNYEPMVIKPFADALVKAGVIADDTVQYITRPGAAEIEIDRKNPRTEVTLEWTP